MDREETIRAVRRMQDFIDEHMNEPITLSQLAGAAAYSQWHCERLFKEYVGKTPFDYIRSLRLSKAAMILRDEKPKIVDIALISCSTPTRALQRLFQNSSESRRKATRRKRRRFRCSFLTGPPTIAEN